MRTQIKKRSFQLEKSHYLMELYMSDQGNYYVELSQTINDEFTETKTISLRETAIENIISKLSQLKRDIQLHRGEQVDIVPNSPLAKDIIDRYYKNISIQAISASLGLREEQVEKVLLEHNVPIVSNVPPSAKYYRRRRKK